LKEEIIMSKVAIVTDSVACLTKEHTEQYGIHVVPIKILFEGKVYHNGVDLAPSEAYQLLEKSPESFSTSPSTPQDYSGIFYELGTRLQDILCITVSAKLSTAFNMANLAKEEIKEKQPDINIEVMDSGTATAAQGFVVLAAAREAVQDKGTAEITEAAIKVKERVQLLFLLDTIRYAYRTGRIPKIAAQMGSMLGVKPIVTISDGLVHMVSAVRSKNRGIERLIKTMKRKVDNNQVHVAVMHTNRPEEAERLKERVAAEFDCAEIFVTEVSPIIGYSVGPGTLALAYYSSTDSI
jgi:DegV family protein with EDD domain